MPTQYIENIRIKKFIPTDQEWKLRVPVCAILMEGHHYRIGNPVFLYVMRAKRWLLQGTWLILDYRNVELGEITSYESYITIDRDPVNLFYALQKKYPKAGQDELLKMPFAILIIKPKSNESNG